MVFVMLSGRPVENPLKFMAGLIENHEHEDALALSQHLQW